MSMSFHEGIRERGQKGDNLLPCPFCGSAAMSIDNDGYQEYFVGCVNESCEIMPHVDGPVPDLKDGIERWNKRGASHSAFGVQT